MDILFVFMLFRWTTVFFFTVCLFIYLTLRPSFEYQPKVQTLWVDRVPLTMPYAYVNLCANMRAVLPTLVLFEQLRSHNCTADFAVLIPREVDSIVGQIFLRFGIKRVVYDNDLFTIKYNVTSKSTTRRDLMLWQKLRAWNETSYEKIVMLDNDLLIRSNIDELFTFPELSGVPQLYAEEKIMFWEYSASNDFVPIVQDDKNLNNGLNSGVLVLEPNQQTFNQLLLAASNLHMRTCCPTQEFLFRHFEQRNRYHRLSSQYNTRKLQKLKNRRPSFIASIKVYHFVEKRKPLMIGRRDCQSDPMALEWWAAADQLDSRLDDYVVHYPEDYDAIVKVREAAISSGLGSKQQLN